MTAAADDVAVEEAFEAYLAGRRVSGAEGGLVSFADAVRASATEPGRPNAALAELLATGLLQDQPGPAARPVRRPPRRRTRMLASALFAKIVSAGLAAKAATAAGVAVVGLATAGFTGNLGPVQHTFATVVDYATPFTAPDSTAGTATDTTGTTTPGTTADPTATTSGTSDAPATPTPFGQQVSQMAHDGHDGKPGVDGQAVSSMARSRHGAGDAQETDAQETPDGQDSETSADDTRDGSGDTAAVTSAPAGTTAGHGDSAGKGHGDR